MNCAKMQCDFFTRQISTHGRQKQIGLHTVTKNFDGLASDIDVSNEVMKCGHFHDPSVFHAAIRSVTKSFRSNNTSRAILRR